MAERAEILLIFRGLRGEGSYRRWWVAFAAWLVVFASLAGALLTYQFASGLEKFGGLEYLSRVAALSISRVVAATVVFQAGLFAWITWAHGMEAGLVRERLRSMALRVFVAAPIAYAASAFIATAAVFFVGSAAYGVSLQTLTAGYGTRVAPLDWVFGLATTLCGVAVLVIAAWFVMPRLSLVSWGLFRKLVVALGAVIVMRVAFALSDAVLDTVLR